MSDAQPLQFLLHRRPGREGQANGRLAIQPARLAVQSAVVVNDFIDFQSGNGNAPVADAHFIVFTRHSTKHIELLRHTKQNANYPRVIHNACRKLKCSTYYISPGHTTFLKQ